MSNVEEVNYDQIDGSSSKSGKKRDKSPGDFPSLIGDLLTRINWKMSMFLFILFIIITSDIFIDKCLRKIPGSVENMTSTNKGTVIQGIFLVIFFIIMDGILSSGVLE